MERVFRVLDLRKVGKATPKKHMKCFAATKRKGPDREPGPGHHWLLLSKLVKHLCSTGEPVATLTH